MTSVRIGVDLGGTKIEAIALGAGGEELSRCRIATPAHDCAAIVSAVAELVAGIERELGATGSVGIGTPGAISPATGLLKNSNTVCLNGQPLDRLLAEALGREVRVANDANCFALSEAVDGAGAGARLVFGVILGTGVGGGVVIDGRALRGPNAIAGEWGHNPLPWAEPSDPLEPCYCGQRGCIETVLSGPGMAADHRRRTGEDLSAAEIAARCERGEAGASETIERYALRLAKGLASVVNVLDPDVIVLGGGLSNVAALYRLVPPLLERHAFTDALSTPLVRARHGDSSGVRGAAWLWPPSTEALRRRVPPSG